MSKRKRIYIDVEGTLIGNPHLSLDPRAVVEAFVADGWDVVVWSGAQVPTELQGRPDAGSDVAPGRSDAGSWRHVSGIKPPELIKADLLPSAGYGSVFVVDDDDLLLRSFVRIGATALPAARLESWLYNWRKLLGEEPVEPGRRHERLPDDARERGAGAYEPIAREIERSAAEAISDKVKGGAV